MTADLSERHVGFVGLGQMGWPMAHNLVEAGYRLVVRDIAADLQEAFAAEHGCIAASAPSDFAETGLVVMMLPDDQIVRSVALEWEDGLASALPPGAVIVDMSSSNPQGTLALGSELAILDCVLLDAPVSGGVPRAELGTLTVMLGGDDKAAMARARPVLEAMSERIFETGGLGTGHAMKALNNYVGGAAYISAVEALEIGKQYGLEPGTMIDVFNASTARSFNTEVVLKEHVLSGRYATGFALGLLAKDVGIAAELAKSTGVDAPVCDLVSQRWFEAAEELGTAVDHSIAHKRWWPDKLAVPAGPGAKP